MAYQTSGNVLVAIKRETTTGVAATAVGATQVRITDSPGLELKRAIIQSAEKRDDGLKTMGRSGGKSVDGSYNAELTIGGATDMLLEAVMRTSWATTTSIGFATLTTVAVGTNHVTASAGSWLTQGVRVGDIFYLSGTSQAGNNSLNVRAIAVTTLTISTTPAAFSTVVAASATGTLVILKKAINPTTPTRYTHTVEQYDQDIDLSELFLGNRATGVKLSFKPNGTATVSYTFMGIDRTILATGTSPWFTSPTLTTGLSLIADDSVILKDGVAVTTFTGFDLDFQITAAGQPVVGSLVSPDIFDNDCAISGSISGLRSDFANLTAYDAETEFSIAIKLEEPNTGPPKSCLSFYIPRCKIAQLSAPVGGGDGAKIETLALMIGPKVAATGHDATAVSIHSSAA